MTTPARGCTPSHSQKHCSVGDDSQGQFPQSLSLCVSGCHMTGIFHWCQVSPAPGLLGWCRGSTLPVWSWDWPRRPRIPSAVAARTEVSLWRTVRAEAKRRYRLLQSEPRSNAGVHPKGTAADLPLHQRPSWGRRAHRPCAERFKMHSAENES